MISLWAFIGSVAAGFLAAPLAAQAEQPGKLYRIGYVSLIANPHERAAQTWLRSSTFQGGGTVRVRVLEGRASGKTGSAFAKMIQPAPSK